MASAIVMRTTGGPGVLHWEPVTVPEAQPHEVLLKHTAIGVNYHDAYVRSGLYKTLALPGIPGLEAAGIVEAVGKDVRDFTPGDRVAYVTRQYGAYSEQRTIDANLLVPLPDAVSDTVAASYLLKGLTAQMLVQHVYSVRQGDWVLVHAAAGGVGTLLCQWAKHLGANVIGTVGSADKVPLALAAGCHSVVLYREEDFVARVREITGGAGVQVAYDAVGKDTFFGSLECLAPFGHLANYGQASGPVPAFEVSMLFPKSNALSRPSVFQHVRTPQLLRSAAKRLFDSYLEGGLKIHKSLEFPLRDAAQAHALLEDRSRLQAIVLRVDAN